MPVETGHSVACVGTFDVIFVGCGTAGSIVATRLIKESPHKRFLILEMGGPTSADVGGTDVPAYFRGTRHPRTIFDVPGEYQNIAFHPQGERYQIPMTDFTYQGMGYGGNSQFNGMLIHVPSDDYFDSAWPSGWRAKAMKDGFRHVFKHMTVSDTPSADGRHYLADIADVLNDIYAANGIPRGDSPNMGGHGPDFYTWPFVASAKGQRGSPVSGFLRDIINTKGEPKVDNLTLMPGAVVDRIMFEPEKPDRADRVRFQVEGAPMEARLSPNGVIVMSAGALNTPRVLLLSGIGPTALHHKIFPNGGGVPFHIDNPLVAADVFDHFGTGMAFTFDGPGNYQAYDYSNYAAHTADLKQYVDHRIGPYAQYGPVSALELKVNPNEPEPVPDLEIFINPFGMGTPGGSFYTSNSFSAFGILLKTDTKAPLQLDQDHKVISPHIYFTHESDVDHMAVALFKLLGMYAANPNIQLLFGPGTKAFPNLRPDNLDDIRKYVAYGEPKDGIYFTSLSINHFGGTCPLSHSRDGGTDPETMRIRGTRNIHVVDASIQPKVVPGHPVATIMACAYQAASRLTAVV